MTAADWAPSIAAPSWGAVFALDGILGFAQTRGIDDRDRQTIERQVLAQRIARRARNLGDNRSVVAGEAVQQARLAGIRRTGDGDAQTVA